MTEKETRDLFRKRVIELNHPDEPKEKQYSCRCMDPSHHKTLKYSYPISFARVLQALNNKQDKNGTITLSLMSSFDAYGWKLTEDGKECDADQQDIETIEKLLSLLQE